MPVRIQRKRTKGWKMPDGAVYVGRPSIWGNPIKVTTKCPPAKAVRLFKSLLRMSQTRLGSSIKYEDGTCALLEGFAMVVWRQTLLKRLPELRGKNLACWCPLDQPCHADVLLELANKEP